MTGPGDFRAAGFAVIGGVFSRTETAALRDACRDADPSRGGTAFPVRATLFDKTPGANCAANPSR